MTATPLPSSPRIEALKRELELGSTTALPAFWDDISRTGTPLVEPIENEPEMRQVTFMWRSQDELQNVVMGSNLLRYDPQKGLMQHLPSTDLWYLTVKARNDLRTTYHFSINDPLTSFFEDKDLGGRLGRMKPDPFNAKQFVWPHDDDDPEDLPFVLSIVEMPGTAPQPWSKPRPGTPSGKVEMHRFRSEILDNERRVWLYTPPGHSPNGKPHPLLVLFDGSAYTRGISAPAVLDNLLADGCIPPFVAVLPDSGTPEMRNRELACHAPFAEFLVHELLPWARQKVQFTDDPRWTCVAVSSYGGLASSYVAFRHPEVFGNVLSQSGSYWWLPEGASEDEWLTRQYALAPRRPLRFYMDVGTLETGHAMKDGGPDQRLSNRHLRDVLQAKGYPLHYTEYSGGHDYIWWQGTLADGLLALLKGRRRKASCGG